MTCELISPLARQWRKPICQVGDLFYIHGTVHRNSMSVNVQQDATVHRLFYQKTALHVSGGFSTNHLEHK